MHDNTPPPPGVDTTRPSPARMYDYALGGKDNYQVDREAGSKILAVAPGMAELATYNRAWLRRVVRYLCQQGIGQFIDIGSGLPTVENVHEVAQRHRAGARVVYVDHEPTVHVHARALLDGDEGTEFVLADARDPDAVLNADETTRLIDWSEPTGLILASVLHFFGDAADPAGTAARLAERLPAGSFVAVSHASSERSAPELRARLDAVYRGASEYLYLRPRGDIAGIVDAVTASVGRWEMVEPGLVPVQDWRPDEDVPPPPLTILGAMVRRVA
ncbi:SAM-dependent methyltransferase [Actinomadura viridis]|uniref:S-adenosyl methyltransferase n=1 Tax=Actinomadura viridis TaxID=58110 RepID=A0A931DJH7_9ACTN|nr:SAM-dependent methyltransferase [Actinomadura viridis]MBG6089874.1 hypothetical protein [Actinomadura viridis]